MERAFALAVSYERRNLPMEAAHWLQLALYFERCLRGAR